MNRTVRKNCILITVRCLGIVLLFWLFSLNVFAAVMYDNDIKNDSSKKGLEWKRSSTYDKETLAPIYNANIEKPQNETKIDPNTVAKYDEKIKHERRVFLSPDVTTKSTSVRYYEDYNELTYIKHRLGIAEVVGVYEWQEVIENQKRYIKLLIQNSDEEKGPPFFAHSGFYKIGDDIYCFDEKSHLIKGIAKDEYNIIYEFDKTNGKFIKMYQG